MAQIVADNSIWYLNTSARDMRSLDVVALSTGKIGVAFGGSLGAEGVIYSALYDLTTATLGPIRTNLLPGAPSGGIPVTTVGELDVEAGAGGAMIVTLHMANSAIGPDGNAALMTQVYSGAQPQGSPVAVNPATLLQNTTDAFATLLRPNGSYVTFHTDYPGGTNLSSGVVMSTFSATGALVGTPQTVLVDRVVFPAAGLDANPESPAATMMANGRIGLVYKENIGTGAAITLFQEMTQAGRLVGPALQLDTGALDPKIITLTSGKMVAIWQSADAFGNGTIKAQMLNPRGDKLGAVFDVAAAHTGSEKLADIVATEDGGFAVSWFSGNHPIARMFDDRGRALGNDFAITDGSMALDLYGAWGLTVTGGNVVGFASGSEFGQTEVLLGQVFGTASTVGRTIIGGAAGNTQTGGALDDHISGLAGRDKISGMAGNDILLGGDDADRINGGAGRDVVIGGIGADTMTGGTGGDVFIFNAATEGSDVITDFNAAEGDKLGFDKLGFGRELFPGFFLPLIGITINNGAVTDANAAGFFFNTTTQVLSYDIDGAGATARVDIATLNGVSSLSVWDMYVS